MRAAALRRQFSLLARSKLFATKVAELPLEHKNSESAIGARCARAARAVEMDPKFELSQKLHLERYSRTKIGKSARERGQTGPQIQHHRKPRVKKISPVDALV